MRYTSLLKLKVWWALHPSAAPPVHEEWASPQAREASPHHLVSQGVNVMEAATHTLTLGRSVIERSPHTVSRGRCSIEQRPHTFRRGADSIEPSAPPSARANSAELTAGS